MRENQKSQPSVPLPSLGSEPAAVQFAKALVKSVAASVPIASSLAQAYSEWENHRLAERLEEFRAAIVVELGALETHVQGLEAKLSESAQESPALLEVTTERVRRETDPGKRCLFARLFCGVLALGNSMPTEDKIALIQQLETLTSQDLSVLKLLSDGRGKKLEDVQPAILGWTFTGDEFKEALVSSIAKLESRGLLAGTAGSQGVNYRGGDGDLKPKNWENSLIVRTVWLLPLGKKLAGLLRLEEVLICPNNRAGNATG